MIPRSSWKMSAFLGAAAVALALAACSSGCSSGDGPAPQANPPPPPPNSLFPLRIAAGGRYLVDNTGAPFLMIGDSPWSLIAQLNRSEVDQYLDDRRARGFNTLIVNLLEHKFSDNPPKNAFGDGPFTTPGDYSTPKEAYFAQADWVIQRAGEKGFAVMLTPSYLGFNGGDEGWYQDMAANGTGRMREYGRFLGNRYKSFENIIWLNGGDYNPPNAALVEQVAEGIREFDTNGLQTAHTAPENAATDIWGGEPWLALNNVYTYGAVYAPSLTQYARPGMMPFFLIESAYEDDFLAANEQRVRTQAYHALLSGAMGEFFGNSPIWHFNSPGMTPSTPWQAALDTRGARSITHLRNLFTPQKWWMLVPDSTNTLLTSGLGSDMDRAVAARASDGSFAIAYMPSSRTISIDLGRLAGPRVTARWYDPTLGIFTTVAGSPFNAAGVQGFVPTGNNSTGFSDWVLVLESTP